MATSANVTCLDLATAPTTLPVIKDQCGETLSPVGEPATEVTWEEGKENCKGTKTYTYTYKDCANLSTTWTFTYNINDNVKPALKSTASWPAAPATQTVCFAGRDNTVIPAAAASLTRKKPGSLIPGVPASVMRQIV